MASGRSRRANAGAKMATLMDSMENDNFYKEQYGGFEEEENDKEFVYQSPTEDEVDSDFSIDENDEPKSDMKKEEKEKKKILKEFSKLSLRELQVYFQIIFFVKSIFPDFFQSSGSLCSHFY